MTEHNPDDDGLVSDSGHAPETDGETATGPAAVEEREEGPVRRALIRATLKPGEGDPPPREPPVFTLHQQPRAGGHNGRGNRNGNQKGSGFPHRQHHDRGGQSRSSSRRGKGRSR